MKNKIVLSLMAVLLSLSAVLAGCGANGKEETSSVASGFNTENVEKPDTEQQKTEKETEKEAGKETEKESQKETETTKKDTEETPTEQVPAEEPENYAYEFEGKYWVYYSEYGNSGYYFGGTTALRAFGEYGINECRYTVENMWITIDGEGFVFAMKDGKLGLSLAEGDGSDMRYYEEVDKAEFEKLFK